MLAVTLHFWDYPTLEREQYAEDFSVKQRVESSTRWGL